MYLFYFDYMIDLGFLLYAVTYFFLILIVAHGMALILGYGRLQYLGFSVPVLVGGFTVSALTCRLAYLFAEMGGSRAYAMGFI